MQVSVCVLEFFHLIFHNYKATQMKHDLFFFFFYTAKYVRAHSPHILALVTSDTQPHRLEATRSRPLVGSKSGKVQAAFFHFGTAL